MAGRRFFIVDEDELRQKIIEMSPEIRRDTERMADLIREMVALERQKAGLDNPRGTIEISPNKAKKHPSEPDLSGFGHVAGRSYRAAGWRSVTDKLKISLLPPKRK
jgi:hypothetical protein